MILLEHNLKPLRELERNWTGNYFSIHQFFIVIANDTFAENWLRKNHCPTGGKWGRLRKGWGISSITTPGPRPFRIRGTRLPPLKGWSLVIIWLTLWWLTCLIKPSSWDRTQVCYSICLREIFININKTSDCWVITFCSHLSSDCFSVRRVRTEFRSNTKGALNGN